MMANRTLAVVAGSAAGLFLSAVALAQTSGGTYDLSWRALSGGGKSAGGNYTEQGAIGQALTKSASGGSYSINGGFFGGGQDKYKRYLPLAAKD